MGHYIYYSNNNLRMGNTYLMPKQKTFTIKNLQENNFSLILSGGASLGLAHIGIIEFLEEQRLLPSEIIGTSIGSIIGALYAIGNTSETIKEKLKDLETKNLFEIKYFQGKIEYKKAKLFLKEIFYNKKMSDAKIPLKIIATNLKNGKKKIFTNKDNLLIYDVIMASIAIPGIFTAKRINHEFFIDGGVSSNLPIEAVEEENIKLAINVVNRKVKDYNYKPPKRGFVNNIISRFMIIKNVSRYYIEEQTESKIPLAHKLILIEPNLKNFNSYKIIDYEKISRAGYLEIKKYFEKKEKKGIKKKKRIKKKRKPTILKKIIKETKKLIN